MKDQSTIILAVVAIAITTFGGYAGWIYQHANTPNPSVPLASNKAVEIGPAKSTQQLEAELATELPNLQAVIAAALPSLAANYDMKPGKLYGQGQWYGTVLTYRGTDTDNRDSLRLLLQKENNQWILRTQPPAPMLSTADYPDVPKKILQDLNQPTTLPGTDNSPQIN